MCFTLANHDMHDHLGPLVVLLSDDVYSTYASLCP